MTIRSISKLPGARSYPLSWRMRAIDRQRLEALCVALQLPQADALRVAVKEAHDRHIGGAKTLTSVIEAAGRDLATLADYSASRQLASAEETRETCRHCGMTLTEGSAGPTGFCDRYCEEQHDKDNAASVARGILANPSHPVLAPANAPGMFTGPGAVAARERAKR